MDFWTIFSDIVLFEDREDVILKYCEFSVSSINNHHRLLEAQTNCCSIVLKKEKRDIFYKWIFIVDWS